MATVAEKTITYLLVDENPDHAGRVEDCLRRLEGSPRIRRVASGAECLAYLLGEGAFADRENYPYPDAVLLDVRMSGSIDGLQTLRAIRSDAEHSGIRVVMLAGPNAEADAQCARDLGASGCITKSRDVAAFQKELGALHRTLMTESPSAEETARPKTEDRANESARRLPLNETETLDQLMKMELPVAYQLLLDIYRRDRWEALQLLLSLNQIVPGRFARLAVTLCEKDIALFAGTENVDWQFIEQVVMNRLPSCTSRDEFAVLVGGISSVLEKNERFDRQAPAWYMWQGFRRAAGRSRSRSRDGNSGPRSPREQIQLQPVGINRWRRIAILAFVLFAVTAAAYVVDKFVLLNM